MMAKSTTRTALFLIVAALGTQTACYNTYFIEKDELAKLDIGVVTLGCVPIKSVRRDEGQLNIDITYGGVTFHPGDYVYADNNGIITSPKALL